MVGAVGRRCFRQQPARLPGRQRRRQHRRDRGRRTGDRRGADPGGGRRQCDHRRLGREHALLRPPCCTTSHAATRCGSRSSRRRSPPKERSWCAPTRPAPHRPQPCAVHGPSGRAAAVGRRFGAQRDRTCPGDRHPLDASSSTDDIVAACNVLRERGARAVIANLGPRGAVVVSATGVDAIPAVRTKVVDTTGAGRLFRRRSGPRAWRLA